MTITISYSKSCVSHVVIPSAHGSRWNQRELGMPGGETKVSDEATEGISSSGRKNSSGRPRSVSRSARRSGGNVSTQANTVEERPHVIGDAIRGDMLGVIIQFVSQVRRLIFDICSSLTQHWTLKSALIGGWCDVEGNCRYCELLKTHHRAKSNSAAPRKVLMPTLAVLTASSFP